MGSLRLYHWLLEELPLFRVFGVAISNTLQILKASAKPEYATKREERRTWYFVSSVLQTPVRSIMVTSTGIMALEAILE